MTDFSKIARQMREDWDRRVNHDYRFWMCESHASDDEMWRSGERDADIILEGLSDLGSKTLLEIGCGVGRLLKANKARFQKVIGFDVSEKAIEKARELVADNGSLELYVGDGYSLNPVPDGSVDVVMSFAAITSMPTEIMASYLREVNRVIRPDGHVRFQIYLGTEQIVAKNDTLHLRCYKKENFIAAIEAAGFELEFARELVLPFQVSFKEIGIEAVITGFRKISSVPAPVAEISELLLPQGETEGTGELTAQEVECWMSLNYARDLADKGETEKARQALDYALAFSKSVTIDIGDLLDQVVRKIEEKDGSRPSAANFLDGNLQVLQRRFPAAYDRVMSHIGKPNPVQISETPEGPVLIVNELCLDHPQKPLKSAENWAEKLLNEPRFRDAAGINVCGFGAGYHVEALQSVCGKPVCVIEPNVFAFVQALSIRDITECLDKLGHISLGEEHDFSWISSDSELTVRSQTQALHTSYCSSVKAGFYGKRGLSTLRPSIALVGPVQGGTLPINNYCARALITSGQRTRVLDMSGFAGGFHNLSSFVFDQYRQSAIQGNYIEMMSQVVIESINEKPIDILICMAQAPMTGRALTELRKRGIITVLWFVEDYLRFTYWKDIAQYYDFVFTIQKGDCINAIRAAGAGEVHYLPVGCDQGIHKPQELTPEEKSRWGSPISFVGAGYHNRQQMLAGLCELPFKIWGTEWPECKPFDRLVQEKGRRLAPEEYVKIFNASDINLNLHSSSERDGVDPYGDFVNPRTFELAAAGAFQLADERLLLPELFEEGKEIITFKNAADLREKINYYLAHPEERKTIAENARQRVLKDHTYQQRLNQMLSVIFSSRYESLKERLDRSPWKKMMSRAAIDEELLKRCEAAYQRGEEPNLDGLVADIVSGKGKLSETEQKLLFLYHVRKQIIRMRAEEGN